MTRWGMWNHSDGLRKCKMLTLSIRNERSAIWFVELIHLIDQAAHSVISLALCLRDTHHPCPCDMSHSYFASDAQRALPLPSSPSRLWDWNRRIPIFIFAISSPAFEHGD